MIHHYQQQATWAGVIVLLALCIPTLTSNSKHRLSGLLDLLSLPPLPLNAPSWWQCRQ